MVVLNGCATNEACSSSVAVRLGNGDGTFGSAVVYPTQATVSTALVVADVNGDGKPDILVSNSCLSGDCTVHSTVSVLLGNGDGTFQAAMLAEAGGENPSALAVGDLNGDGKLDVVVLDVCVSNCPAINGPVSEISALIGNGDGSFQPAVDYETGSTVPANVIVADVNGDGIPDVIASNCGLQSSCAVGGVSVLLNLGDGTLAQPVSYPSGGASAGALALSDVNEDGKPDALVVNMCTTNFKDCTLSPVGVLLNNGDGTFQNAVSYESGGRSAEAIAVQDVDGDRNPDLLVGLSCGTEQDCTPGTTSSFVSVLLANGPGAFRTPVLFDSGGYGPQAIVAADINGDGRPDVIVLNHCNIAHPGCDYGTVGVLLNATSATGAATTTTALGSSQNPLPYGQSLTLSATVTAQTWGTPTGTVGFAIDGNFLNYATLSGQGVATLTLPSPAVGNHNITADYYGDQNFGTSSGALQQVVEGGVVTVLPTTLDFGTQPYGSASQPLVVALSNTGNVPVNIASIAVTSGASSFTQNNDCPSALAGSARCTIRVTFTPAAYGSSSGTLSVQDDAVGNPQSAQLLGTTDFTLSTTAITFPGQYVGTSGTSQTVSVTNTGTTAAPIVSITTNSLDFPTANDCGSSLAPAASCNVSVQFNPTATGARSGALSIARGSGPAQSVALSGTGLDFSVAASGSSSVTVSDGQPASYSLALTPVAGFVGTVSLACSGAPSGSTCAVAPNPVVLEGASPSPVVVTVTTLANSAARNSAPRFHFAAWLSIASLPGLLLLGGKRSTMTRVLRSIAFFSLLLLLAAGMACGGGANAPSGNGGAGGGGTPSGSYPINVTATFSAGSTTLKHTTTLTLVVH